MGKVGKRHKGWGKVKAKTGRKVREAAVCVLNMHAHAIGHEEREDGCHFQGPLF